MKNNEVYVITLTDWIFSNVARKTRDKLVIQFRFKSLCMQQLLD